MGQVQFIDLSDVIRTDPRGMAFFLFQHRQPPPSETLATFHLVSVAPGETRGQHYHPAHDEWLYLFAHPGVFIWQDRAGQVQERLIEGDHTMIRIHPGIAHAVSNPGPGRLYLLAWREPAADGIDAGQPETVFFSLSS